RCFVSSLGGAKFSTPRGGATPPPREPLLELPGLSPDACRLGRLFAARHHSARLLVPGGCRAALLDCQPARQGRRLRPDVRPRSLAVAAAGGARHLSPL